MLIHGLHVVIKKSACCPFSSNPFYCRYLLFFYFFFYFIFKVLKLVLLFHFFFMDFLLLACWLFVCFYFFFLSPVIVTIYWNSFLDDVLNLSKRYI